MRRKLFLLFISFFPLFLWGADPTGVYVTSADPSMGTVTVSHWEEDGFSCNGDVCNDSWHIKIAPKKGYKVSRIEGNLPFYDCYYEGNCDSEDGIYYSKFGDNPDDYISGMDEWFYYIENNEYYNAIVYFEPYFTICAKSDNYRRGVAFISGTEEYF